MKNETRFYWLFAIRAGNVGNTKRPGVILFSRGLFDYEMVIRSGLRREIDFESHSLLNGVVAPRCDATNESDAKRRT